jgi:hypothetical protein
MITFEQARQLVAAHVAPDELDVAPHGFEDAEDWLVVVKERSEILVLGGPTYLVNRATGRVHEESYVANFARFGAMTSTGGRTFCAENAGGSLEWFERAPHLVGTPDLVARVEAVLASSHSIMLTPTGPSVRAVESNAEGVFAALLSLGIQFYFSGDVPSVPAVPDDAVA